MSSIYSRRIDVHIGHNEFFAAPVGGATSCGYATGGRKAQRCIRSVLLRVSWIELDAYPTFIIVDAVLVAALGMLL